MVGFRNTSKRILYTLYKKTNLQLSDFSFCGLNGVGSRGKKGMHAAEEVLNRLIKKGLVGKTKYRGGTKAHYNIYYLTEEGKKVAKPIVQMIDDYKQW